MAVATITTSTLSGTLTTVSIANALRDILITAGYATFDSYLSGTTEHRIMSLNSSIATKGTVYLQISVNSSGSITYLFHEAWNTTTKVGTNSSNSSSVSIATGTTALNLYSVNHPEFKGVMLEQGTVQGVIALIRPKTTAPSWWNENTNPFVFLSRYNTTPSNSRLGSTTTPFGSNIDHEYLQNSKLQDGNAQNSSARSILPLCILSAGVGGVIASCDDVIICSSNTARPLDTITVSPSEIYTYVWGNALNSGIAIRTV